MKFLVFFARQLHKPSNARDWDHKQLSNVISRAFSTSTPRHLIILCMFMRDASISEESVEEKVRIHT